MNGRILHLGGDEHDIVQLLLPWYDGDHLDDSEAARVRAHLGTCARCQADIAWQRRLREIADAQLATAGEPSVAAANRGWDALRAQLAAQDASPASTPVARPRRRAVAAWGWLLAWQSTLIAGLAALVVTVMLVPQHPDSYRALGLPGGAADASLVVVFRPEANEAQIRQALRDSDARLVDGPTATGAYLLSVAPGRHADALARLRAEPGVQRVESLAPEPLR